MTQGGQGEGDERGDQQLDDEQRRDARRGAQGAAQEHGPERARGVDQGERDARRVQGQDDGGAQQDRRQRRLPHRQR